MADEGPLRPRPITTPHQLSQPNPQSGAPHLYPSEARRAHPLQLSLHPSPSASPSANHTRFPVDSSLRNIDETSPAPRLTGPGGIRQTSSLR